MRISDHLSVERVPHPSDLRAELAILAQRTRLTRSLLRVSLAMHPDTEEEGETDPPLKREGDTRAA